MSQSLYTVVAHKFLSAIVIRVVQSLDNDISQSVELWYIPASHVQLYNLVQLLSGMTGLSLNGLIQYHLLRVPYQVTSKSDELPQIPLEYQLEYLELDQRLHELFLLSIYVELPVMPIYQANGIFK